MLVKLVLSYWLIGAILLLVEMLRHGPEVMREIHAAADNNPVVDLVGRPLYVAIVLAAVILFWPFCLLSALAHWIQERFKS